VRKIAMICFALLLVACGDPHDTKVPADISKWSSTVKPALQKLPHDEQVLFTDYVRLHTVGAATGGLHVDKADPIPKGMTIGKAIEEQRGYIARQQARETEEQTGKDMSRK
jgi:hypothetical protein